MTINADEARLLAQIGFLGISRGALVDSKMIFEALSANRPDQEVGAIGRALIELGAGNPAAARDILAKARQSEAVMSFSVLANVLLGERDQAAEILGELEDIGASDEMIQMARSAMDDTSAAGGK